MYNDLHLFKQSCYLLLEHVHNVLNASILLMILIGADFRGNPVGVTQFLGLFQRESPLCSCRFDVSVGEGEFSIFLHHQLEPELGDRFFALKCKKFVIPILLRLFESIKKYGNSCNSSTNLIAKPDKDSIKRLYKSISITNV